MSGHSTARTTCSSTAANASERALKHTAGKRRLTPLAERAILHKQCCCPTQPAHTGMARYIRKKESMRSHASMGWDEQGSR